MLSQHRMTLNWTSEPNIGATRRLETRDLPDLDIHKPPFPFNHSPFE
jgi:hypothetical protein